MNLLLADLELKYWRAAGRRAQIWWRDDDARRFTPQLARLLMLAKRMHAPLTLAVIPNDAPEEVANALREFPHVSICQHGSTHANRAPTGANPSELRDDDTIAEATARVLEGASRLRGLPGVTHVYAPPFNQVNRPLRDALSALGFAGLSAWGELATQENGLLRIDTHVDLLRWGGGARFRGAWKFTAGLAKHLRARRLAKAWDDPIGVLTHHLDMDEPSWAYFTRFLERVNADRSMTIVGLPHVLAAASADATPSAQS